MGCGFSSGGGSDKDGTDSDEGEKAGPAKTGVAADCGGDARTDAG